MGNYGCNANVENKWNDVAEADTVKGSVEGEAYEEVMMAMNKMKLGKAAKP